MAELPWKIAMDQVAMGAVHGSSVHGHDVHGEIDHGTRFITTNTTEYDSRKPKMHLTRLRPLLFPLLLYKFCVSEKSWTCSDEYRSRDFFRSGEGHMEASN